MSYFDTQQHRAAWLVVILGVAIAIAMAPYASGLLGAPILYVVFGGLHEWLTVRIRRRSIAAILVMILAIVLIVLPLTWMVSLLVGQAQGAAAGIANSPLLDRISALTIAGYEVGPELKDAGAKAVTFVGGGALSLLGKATGMTLNLMFAFFGFYYLLMAPQAAWNAVRPYIPFSDDNVKILQERFVAVTKSTIIGTGLSAVAQGILVGLGFWVAGLGNPMFWGVVTVVFSIMPVIGSGLIWGPGAIVLYTGGHPVAALVLALYGGLLVGNIDNVIRPIVSNRYAQVHPLITLIGAVAGVSYMGILGLLVGPLALSYFFELLTMYRREFLPAVEA